MHDQTNLTVGSQAASSSNASTIQPRARQARSLRQAGSSGESILERLGRDGTSVGRIKKKQAGQSKINFNF